MVGVITNVSPADAAATATFSSLDYNNDFSATSRTFGIRLDAFVEKINEIIATPVPESAETAVVVGLFALIFMCFRGHKSKSE